jgi:hypothetical protein
MLGRDRFTEDPLVADILSLPKAIVVTDEPQEDDPKVDHEPVEEEEEA